MIPSPRFTRGRALLATIVLLALLGAIAVAQRIHHTLHELDGKT